MSTFAVSRFLCVIITAGPITQLFAGGGRRRVEDMCYERRRAEACVDDGTREEPGTITQGAPVFPGSSRLGIEPKTPLAGWLVQDPTTRPIGDLIPTF